MLDPNHWPAVFYGPEGQNQIFNHPSEVPEGWHDNPAKVGDPDAVTEIIGLDEALAAEGAGEEDEGEGEGEGEGEEDTTVDVPDYDDVTAAEIKTLLGDYNVEYTESDSKRTLYDKLVAAMTAE